MVEGKNTELAEMLASGDAARVAEACDDVAERYQSDFGLGDEAVAAVKRLGSPSKKAARLAGALRRCGAGLGWAAGCSAKWRSSALASVGSRRGCGTAAVVHSEKKPSATRRGGMRIPQTHAAAAARGAVCLQADP